MHALNQLFMILFMQKEKNAAGALIVVYLGCVFITVKGEYIYFFILFFSPILYKTQ